LANPAGLDEEEQKTYCERFNNYCQRITENEQLKKLVAMLIKG
jgi:hypothetical protein